MDRVTHKDLNEIRRQLSFGQNINLAGKQIKITGRKAINLPKKCLGKLKSWWKNGVERLNNYVADEKQQIIDRKVEKIDNKIETASDVYLKFADNPAFQVEGSFANDMLNAVNERVDNLEAKKEKTANKKFGLFRVSAIAGAKAIKVGAKNLKKITTDKINEVQERRAARKTEKQEQKKEVLKAKEAVNLYQSQVSIQSKMAAIAKQMADLQKQLQELNKKNAEFAEVNGMSPEEYINSINPQPTLEEPIELDEAVGYHR